MKHIIGLYRENGKIVPLLGDSPHFQDMGIKREWYSATLIPLEIVQSANQWYLTDDKDYLPDDLKTIIAKNQFFCTTTEEKSPYYALMYMPKADTVDRFQVAMARMGALMRKTDTGFEPMTLKVSGYEYVIEAKGVGSPVGGFPHTHFRNQAGTNNSHLRVTGGMGLAGAEREFLNLCNMKAIEDQIPDGEDMRALGLMPFAIHTQNQRIDMALLLRLAPSTLRFSFYNNPAMTQHLGGSQSQFMIDAGKESSKYFSLPSPAQHRNNSWNNMVYVSENRYVLTDFEELTTLATGHCNLDLMECLYPPYLHTHPFRHMWTPQFISGLKAGVGCASKWAQDAPTTDLCLYNAYMMEKVAPNVIKTRLNMTMNTDFIDENVTAIHYFAHSDYFSMPTLEWVERHGIPSMEKQRKVLQELIAKNATLQHQNEVVDTHKPASDQASEFGAYITAQKIENLLLGEFKFSYEVYEREQMAARWIEEMKAAVATGKIPIDTHYLTEHQRLRINIKFFDFGLIAYPFLGVLSVYCNTETRFLEGALKSNEWDAATRKVLSDSLTKCQTLYEQLKTDPETIKAAFALGNKAVHDLIALPYQRWPN
ncbi:MAG: hypothetical protein O3A01_00715 [bacterium]|nr:hypothetical protein [bacterium]